MSNASGDLQKFLNLMASFGIETEQRIDNHWHPNTLGNSQPREAVEVQLTPNSGYRGFYSSFYFDPETGAYLGNGAWE